MAELAERSGLSRDVISDIENGRRDRHGMRRRDITVDELMAIARAFNMQAAGLLPADAYLSKQEMREKDILRSERMIGILEREIAQQEGEISVLSYKLDNTRDRLMFFQDRIVRLRAAGWASQKLGRDVEELD